MRELPPPRDLSAVPRQLISELTALVPEAEVAGDCVALLEGADPEEYAPLLPHLAGRPGIAGFPEYWPRVWAARGLLYVWDDSAAGPVLDGLRDEHWRVAEMCLKVSAKRELPAAEDTIRLVDYELPRVRAAAVRALGVGGDTEHVDAVVTALSDPEEQVRRAAARALERMEKRLDLPPHRAVEQWLVSR